METPPGAQTQTDWAEYPHVDLGAGPEPLSALVMVQSHSRKPAVVWSSGLGELQELTDDRLDRWTRRACCLTTGETVHDSWQAELERLRPLPILPEPFDVAVSRRVGRDCLGRQYAVPFRHAYTPVEVRGCAGVVQIWAEGRLVKKYPRSTKERLLMDPDCFEGEATDRVAPPPLLGRMGKKLQEIYELPVEARPLDLYATLSEVAR